MAELTYEQLRHKTLAELRDMAKGIEHEAVQGYTQMNKEHLVVGLANALGIQHEHHSTVGIDKSSIKRSLLESLLSLSDKIHARVIAEGVEQEAERATLLALGVELGQGFLFHREDA